MTTENVTVLFTDMVGSTTLASGLSPDAADELRRGHFSILRQAVAQAGGTEVKNLGDGLMVVFGSTSAALACAVGMQQGIERDNHAAALAAQGDAETDAFALIEGEASVIVDGEQVATARSGDTRRRASVRFAVRAVIAATTPR